MEEKELIKELKGIRTSLEVMHENFMLLLHHFGFKDGDEESSELDTNRESPKTTLDKPDTTPSLDFMRYVG